MYYNVKDKRQFPNRKSAKEFYGTSTFAKKLKSREITFTVNEGCATIEKQSK